MRIPRQAPPVDREPTCPACGVAWREHVGAIKLCGNQRAYREATESLLAYMLMVQDENTDEWLNGLVDAINEWAATTGDADRVERFRWGLRIVKGGGQ